MAQCADVAGQCGIGPSGSSPVARGGIPRSRAAHARPLRAAVSAAARTIWLVTGLWLFASGLALMVRADLGLSAWDVFHDAISRLTPMTFGQVVVAVSIVVLVASLALGIRPGIGTAANAVLVGVFTDAVLQLSVLQGLPSAPLFARVVAMVAGICSIALGTALYIAAGLGAGPRDALMLGLARRSARSVGAARSLIEIGVLVAGAALGGSVGIGTIAFVILIGPAINVSFRVFGMEPRHRSHSAPLRRSARAIGAWGRRGQLGGSESMQASRETGGRI